MAKDLKNILLSTIEENKIKEKTPDKLPLNPTAEGWSGQEVRRFLAKSLIDSEGSFLAEFKKKMIEIKAQFEDVFGDGDGDIQGQIDSIIQNIDEVELTASTLATTVLNNYNSLNNLKVNKTLTILGIDLQDDITLSEFKTALGDATLFANGLMSALDKQNLAQTMIDIQSLFSGKADKTVLTSTIQAVTDLQNNKVPKTTTIIGLDLQDNILIGEFKEKLGNATQSAAGLLSAEDKTHLDGLVALLETNDDNNVVDTIGEILAIFQNYPEGAELVTILQGKVDKVVGKGLSTNDFTDEYKNKVDQNTQQIINNQNNITQLQTNKQDKLVAGDSITIDENNVIEVDLNEMAYFDYAGRIYGDKYSLLKNAWEHSLTVDPLEISENSSQSNPRGKAEYPNGATEGVIIPQGITSIGVFAFFNWPSNNQPLVIPNSVTSIGHYTFYGWTSNNHPLVIPNSVTNIGGQAFTGWLSVPYVEMKATTPPSLAGPDAFANQNNAPIYVPDESVDDYKTATNWVDLADRIFPMSDKLVGGYININYSDLVTLRDSNNLKKGAFYRIIDYETTTVQAETKSAGHLFDIIVQALDEKTLSENASAIHSVRDTDGYFANSKLETWELKYCLDNDTNRFAWADDVNGKGVIYRMIDEFNNDVPYDFKNIQFKRKLTDGELDLDSGIDTWVYTFTMSDIANVRLVDYSLKRNTEYQNDDDEYDECANNSIKKSILNYQPYGLSRIQLNDNVFLNIYDGRGYYYYYSCHSNTFGSNCHSNTIGNNCHSNTIGNNCHSNTIGNYFENNTIGNYFYYNTIRNGFSKNTIGNDFYYNTIGDDFYYNTIGDSFSKNTIGNTFYSNTIGNDIRYNTIGNYFNFNTIGNYFIYNTVGNYVRYIQFSLDGTYGNQIRYLYLKSGLSGASSNNRLDLYYDGLYHRTYPTTFEIIANGNIISSWEETPLTRTGKVKETKTTATWSDI